MRPMLKVYQSSFSLEDGSDDISWLIISPCRFLKVACGCNREGGKCSYLIIPTSVADPDPFDMDPDPAFHFDTDPDPAFQCDTDPDPTVLYGSESGFLPFQKGNEAKTVLFLYTFT